MNIRGNGVLNIHDDGLLIINLKVLTQLYKLMGIVIIRKSKWLPAILKEVPKCVQKL